MIETVVIGERFNGPPGSGNGGYSAGLFAALHTPATGSATRVTLRRPPPLGRQLTVRHSADGVTVHDGELLVAEVDSAELDPADPVAPVDDDTAAAASSAYPGFAAHPFPTCFVCGPARPDKDGLGLYPGRLPDGRTAAPFHVPAEISPILLWAALDCPGGWAVPVETRPYVLGQITARVVSLPEPGERCVVVGEMLGEQGRRGFVRTAVYSKTGGLLAQANAVWIAIAGAAVDPQSG